MNRLLAVALVAVPLAFAAGTAESQSPTPQLTAIQYQEQQINTLKGAVRVLQQDLKCIEGPALGVVQITTTDADTGVETPWLAVAVDDDSDATYVPVLKARCLS